MAHATDYLSHTQTIMTPQEREKHCTALVLIVITRHSNHPIDSLYKICAESYGKDWGFNRAIFQRSVKSYIDSRTFMKD